MWWHLSFWYSYNIKFGETTVGLQQLVFTGEAFIMRFGYEIGHLKPNSIMFVRYLKIINTLQEKEHASWSKLSEELHKLIRWLVVVL